MDLKEFVALSLKQIIDGVSEAQNYAKQNGAKVGQATGNWDDNTWGEHQEVNFDVAVSSQENAKKSGKAGITVLSWFNTEGEISSGEQNGIVSRIKFNVMLQYPNSN